MNIRQTLKNIWDGFCDLCRGMEEEQTMSSMQDEENKVPEIPEEIQQYLSNAKRHHYVPEFLLRRFSTNPADEHPPIYRLDVKTGAISRLSTINCAVIGHYNRLSVASGLPAGFAEAMLAYTEGQAALLIEKLLHGGILNLPERVAFSTFLMAQQMRTPRGREWLRFGQEQATKFWLLKQIYENRDVTREHLGEDLGREPTEDEIDQSIREMAEPLERGDLTVSISSDQEVLGMFVPAPELIPVIGEMNWTLLEAPAGQSFIISDDPLDKPSPRSQKQTRWMLPRLRQPIIQRVEDFIGSIPDKQHLGCSNRLPNRKNRIPDCFSTCLNFRS